MEAYIYKNFNLPRPNDLIGTDRFHDLDWNFDEAVIYNSEQVSGLLNLVLMPKNNVPLITQYPIINPPYIDILFSKDEQKYRFDMFWDVTKNRGEFNPNMNQTIWKTELNGCPDKDSDGVADNEDSCPDIKGLKELGGCPDTDGDGVADKEDTCPNVKGLKELGGCPDSDGDGIADKDDTCPNAKGTKALNGCPDKDSDGVADKDDVCPDVAGLIENKGCPAVKAAELKVFEKALNGIKFSSGRDKISSSSYKVLGDVVKIMEENPSYNLKIKGHTDSSGDDAKNLELSKKRASAVQAYLVKKGIDQERLTSEGFGETIPVAENKTSKGRALNRRVELKVEFTKLVK
ncbi:MAG: OmpA family protein [Flavobacteriales bacterium]|nr:OmpA family protein [Flavobacteriales bacterium]